MTSTPTTTGGTDAPLGAELPTTAANRYNAQRFLAERVVSEVSTAIPVRVVAVSNTFGALAPVGTVDVLPLVDQIDGYGNATPHETVFGVSYFRYQGGTSAIILDPVVGDLGLMIVCDRDISVVKEQLKNAVPGSRRRFSLADGVYLGVCLSREAPTQYVRFTNDGIIIVDKSQNRIVMSSSGIDLNP